MKWERKQGRKGLKSEVGFKGEGGKERGREGREREEVINEVRQKGFVRKGEFI